MGKIDEQHNEIVKTEDEFLKDQLIARLSHEIRNPLNAIIGFSEQLQKTTLNSTQEEYLDVIDKSSKFLLDLVNNILQYSGLHASETGLDETDFELSKLVSEVHSSFKQRAKEKGLNLSLEKRITGNTIYRGDAFKIRQVLINLLSNAIKFTDYGFVSLSVEKLEGKSKNKDNFRFIVKDSGIGIRKDQQQMIFREYRQASSGISRKHGGVGLGLTICKNLVEIMGGEIKLNSVPGKGSEFIVEFQLEISTLKNLAQDIITIDSNALAEKSALIVDDDSLNRLLARIILQGFNMVIDEAADGKEALQMMEKNEYDVVLLDLHMPVLSGKDVASFMRKNKKKSPKLLAVTAEVIRSELDSLKESGFSDYLIKPYQEITLFNKLCKVLDIDIRVEPDSMESRRLVVSDKPTYNLAALRSVSRDQDDFFFEMISTFVRNAKKGVSELENALGDNDLDQLVETSHRLIPSYKHLEIRTVVSHLTELKARAKENTDQSLLNNLVSRIRLESQKVIEQLEKEKP